MPGNIYLSLNPELQERTKGVPGGLSGRIHLPRQEPRARSSVWEDTTSRTALKAVRPSSRVCAPEPNAATS